MDSETKHRIQRLAMDAEHVYFRVLLHVAVRPTPHPSQNAVSVDLLRTP